MKGTKEKPRLIESARSNLSMVYLIVLLLALRWTVVEPYVVPTGSMEPTLKCGDRLYALKCAYDIRLPFTEFVLFRTGKVKRGDVILFRYPNDPGLTYVKRAIGLPGDHIKFDAGVLYVNGQASEKAEAPKREVMYDIDSAETKTLYVEKLGDVKHYVILDRSYDNDLRTQVMRHRYVEELTVPEGHIFAVGDNRDNSFDSRAWGFVPMENLKGRGMFIWFSSYDSTLKDNLDPHESLPSRLVSFVVDFFKHCFHLFTGEAHLRPERVGTLIP